MGGSRTAMLPLNLMPKTSDSDPHGFALWETSIRICMEDTATDLRCKKAEIKLISDNYGDLNEDRIKRANVRIFNIKHFVAL